MEAHITEQQRTCECIVLLDLVCKLLSRVAGLGRGSVEVGLEAYNGGQVLLGLDLLCTQGFTLGAKIVLWW